MSFARNSNVAGLVHTITAPFVNGSVMELGCCLYHPNRVGSGVGPRRMEVCLPHASTMQAEGKLLS